MVYMTYIVIIAIKLCAYVENHSREMTYKQVQMVYNPLVPTSA